MEKVAPISKFVVHSNEIIWQSKIKGPLRICFFCQTLPMSDIRPSIEWKKMIMFNVFFHLFTPFLSLCLLCLVDLPEVTGTHRKFRSIVSSLIGMDKPKISQKFITKVKTKLLFVL